MRKFCLFVFIATLSAGLMPWSEIHAQSDDDGMPFRPPPGPRPVVVDVQAFQTWRVRCTKGTPQTLLPGIKVTEADRQKLRDCRAVTVVTLNNSPLLPVRLSFSIIGKRTKIRLLTFIPPRFVVTNMNGPTLKVDAKKIDIHAMHRCTPVSCASSADVPISQIASLGNAKSMALVLTDLPGTKPLELNLPTPGLGPALDLVRKMAPSS